MSNLFDDQLYKKCLVESLLLLCKVSNISEERKLSFLNNLQETISTDRFLQKLIHNSQVVDKELRTRAIQQTRKNNPLYKVHDKVRNYVVDNAVRSQPGNIEALEKGQKYGEIAGTTSTAALAAAILYTGYKIYKRFLSSEARICKKYSGAEFDLCVKRIRVKALKAQISELQKSKTHCNHAKKPQKCKAAIDEKIRKLHEKIAKINLK